ncbi:MAG: NTP transferase domain-containing protein [Clostridia bacterium]|nr:NTP transferase domain-containing protein [Clostridia bacterium]
MENLRAIVPAAGKGTRLKSSANIPKALHELCGKPLLEHVLSQLDFIKPENICIVVGYLKEQIIGYFGERYKYAEQAQQLGTGHAVMVCEPLFSGFDGTVLVTFGDMPLFRRSVMKAMCERHAESGAACTLLTAVNPELKYWARVVRDENGRFARIVEAKDCTPEQALITELFSGVLAFDSRRLFETLPRLSTNNAQGEYYLTEVPELMARDGLKVETYMTDDGDDLRGVNTPEDLLICEQVLKKRQSVSHIVD